MWGKEKIILDYTENGLTVNKENIHWIREDLKIDKDTPTVYESRIRYRQKLTPCSITPMSRFKSFL